MIKWEQKKEGGEKDKFFQCILFDAILSNL